MSGSIATTWGVQRRYQQTHASRQWDSQYQEYTIDLLYDRYTEDAGLKDELENPTILAGFLLADEIMNRKNVGALSNSASMEQTALSGRLGLIQPRDEEHQEQLLGEIKYLEQEKVLFAQQKVAEEELNLARSGPEKLDLQRFWAEAWYQQQSGLIANSLRELRKRRESEWSQIRQQRRTEELDANFERRLRAFELEFGSMEDLIGDSTQFVDW